MAKSKNSSQHNQSKKNHKNGYERTTTLHIPPIRNAPLGGSDGGAAHRRTRRESKDEMQELT